MPRLFIAIDIPSRQRKVLASMKDDAIHARWTPAEQYHITLRFLGKVDDEKTARLAEALSTIESGCPEVHSAGLDAFPNLRRPRVLIVKVEPDPVLMSLQKDVDRIATELEIEQDRKSFNPHVTLARLKEGARPAQVREYVPARSEFRIDPFTATEFHLYESKVSSKGAVHTVLRTYALRAK